MADQPGFFDVDERYAALSAAVDPLERLAAMVDFEIFRPVLDAALARSDRRRGEDTPEGWSAAERAQKDRDACWTLKRGRAKPKPEGTQRQAKLQCRSSAIGAISASNGAMD
jgi:hypothetical protein